MVATTSNNLLPHDPGPGDPGGDTPNSEDGSTRVDEDSSSDATCTPAPTCHSPQPPSFSSPPPSHSPSSSTSSGNSNVSCPADAHYSLDHDCDKTPFMASDADADADAVPTPGFARAIPFPDISTPHSSDNHPAIPHADSKCADATQHSPPQRLAHPIDADHFDRTQSTASAFTHTPPAPRPDTSSNSGSVPEDVQTNRPVSAVTPSPSANILPAILRECVDATPCLLSLRHVAYPPDFDATRTSTPDATHSHPTGLAFRYRRPRRTR